VKYRQNNDNLNDKDYDSNDDDDFDDKEYDPYDDDDVDDYDPDDDDDELAVLRAKRSRNITKSVRYRTEHREQVVATKKLYRERNREFIAVSKKCYRERHRARVAVASKRYRERHRERVAEYDKRYREKHRAQLREYNKAYREKHRAQHAERKKRYRENNREQCLAYQRRYREAHRERLNEIEKRRYAAMGEEKRRAINAKRRRVYREKKRTLEKWKALGPLTLTIPLTDCLKSIPVTSYVQAFCDSLESVDTNVPPAENDSHTLMDLDSGTMQVVDPPDLDDLSFLRDLLKDMTPDDWEQIMDDVEESSSSFDMEELLPPEDLVHGEDMSPDEGIDLLYDLVT